MCRFHLYCELFAILSIILNRIILLCDLHDAPTSRNIILGRKTFKVQFISPAALNKAAELVSQSINQSINQSFKKLSSEKTATAKSEGI
jgi:hypothetical protein